MRIALCLSGYFNSKKNPNSFGSDGFEYIYKEILKKHNVDVYIHSWDLDHEEIILELYRKWLVDCLFEKQIDFKPLFYENQLDEYSIHHSPFYNSFSQYYSVQKSFEILKNKGKKYDCVIKSRFDLGRINRSGNSPLINIYRMIKGMRYLYPVQCINLNLDYDMRKFYCAKWSNKEFELEGPADMWFYSNQSNMEKFSNVYDFLSKEIKKDSEFEKWAGEDNGGPVNVIKGWKWFLMNYGLWDIKVPVKSKWS